MSNPIRFGQEFQGRIANPRDVLVFSRAKNSASRSSKVTIDQPELSIDEPGLSAAEKLDKVRVGTLVKEYLAAQELQLLGEGGMSDAIRVFVEKDDPHAIQSYVTVVGRESLKELTDGSVVEKPRQCSFENADERRASERSCRRRGRTRRNGKTRPHLTYTLNSYYEAS
jgi:double-strand break repair protein MRE11